MIGDSEIQELHDNIKEMEQELSEKKKALREAKYAGLRTAMQARKDADEAVRQELKELGIHRLLLVSLYTGTGNSSGW